MKISKAQLINLIGMLEDCVNDMEDKNVDEISTNCNTYGMSNFISFGCHGYLNLDKGYIEVDGDDDDDY